MQQKLLTILENARGRLESQLMMSLTTQVTVVSILETTWGPRLLSLHSYLVLLGYVMEQLSIGETVCIPGEVPYLLA